MRTNINYELIKQEIITKMKVKSKIVLQDELDLRIDFIQKQLLQANKFSLVLGISGGVDSSLCGFLCQLAINDLRKKTKQESYKFCAVRMPYHEQMDESDAKFALDFINPDQIFVVNIGSGTDGLCGSIEDAVGCQNIDKGYLDFIKGNTKARMRMAMQFHIAAMMNGLVVGTDHSAESIVGFYTKFGDGACDLAPLFGLNKRQIKSLAKFLGAESRICDKIPTADLTDSQPLVSDEDVLGVTYDDIDDFLEGLQVSESAQKIIINKYLSSQHKRKPIPVPV